RLGQHVRLVDCLQFADKAQIVAHIERLRKMTRFDSKRQIETIGRRLEKLRNNLAHSQDIITSDWQTIVTLAANVTSILDGPPAQRQPGSLAQANAEGAGVAHESAIERHRA